MERHKQLEFALTREEKLMLVAAATFGQTMPTTRRLRALLENIELVTGRLGCFPSIDLLAGRMGVTHRTIQRTIRLGESLGLIATTSRIVPGYGQVENLYHVAWDRLRTFVEPDELTRIDHALGRRPPTPKNTRDLPASAELIRGRDLSPGAVKCHRGPRTDVTGPPDTVSPRPIDLRDFRKITPPPALAVRTDPTERRELEEEVFQAGVNLAAAAVGTALAAGCTVAEIRAAVVWYCERQSQFEGPGVLYSHLIRQRPGQAVDRGWPKTAQAGKWSV